MRGKLIVVVGPSGVGKDTLIDGAKARLADDPRFHFVRRAVTRPAEAGGEDHEPISEDECARRAAAGEFFVHWRAHGLCYGAPIEIGERLARGQNVILNGSRGAVAEIAAAYDLVDVIHIDAPPAMIAARLAARGRENAAEIAARRAREAFKPVAGINLAAVMNSGTIEQGIERFMAALLGAAHLPLTLKRAPIDIHREPLCLLHAESRIVSAASLGDAAMVEVFWDGPLSPAPGGLGAPAPDRGRSICARLALTTDPGLAADGEAALSPHAFGLLGAPEGASVEIRRSPTPRSRAALRRKVSGATLGEGDLSRIVRDLVEGRYSPAETAGFLVAASNNLTTEEIVALTRQRAEMMTPLQWDAPLVADKHSMGGVPGSRVTLILAPIVAAHGLLFPKTSSRAITSAAGTADAMEAIARVDLDRAEMARAVAAAQACVVWSGRVNHSPLDDVMNAINRPLGVSSRLLDVSSILSKKLVAGATHALVDLPIGPSAKIKDEASGRRLAALFEEVGRGVGLVVEARLTDGRAPIGRGIGPALELRDVLAVLRGDPAAPADLRAKAAGFAGRILEWDPAVGPGAGLARAEALLASGAALEAFERMVEAQGRRARMVEPGLYAREVRAPRGGVLRRYDGFALAGLARAAGAPSDKSAGLDILVSPGERATAGQPVLRLHAGQEQALLDALEAETPEAAFEIE